jgi:hypothetical protein
MKYPPAPARAQGAGYDRAAHRAALRVTTAFLGPRKTVLQKPADQAGGEWQGGGPGGETVGLRRTAMQEGGGSEENLLNT